MRKKGQVVLVVLLIAVLSVSGAQAKDGTLEEDYPWRYHKAPMDFRFGNMIDSHQQSHLDRNGILHGFIYIHDTGDETLDGYPIADKAHCPTGPCMVGWVIKGVKIKATLINKSPRIWLIDPDDLPRESGYSHFHWLGLPHSPGGTDGLVVGWEYEGYLMKRIAPASFFWLGGPGSNSGGSSGGSCGGHDSGGDEGGGCTDSEHEEGGCSGHDGMDSGDEGGCSDGEHEEGGCAGGGHEGGSGGRSGRLVVEGVDLHSNVVTTRDGTWQGGCHDD